MQKGEKKPLSLYDRTLIRIKERKERILSGKINCIPWGLPRFEKDSPGIEQGKYYLVTANSKVGRVLPLWSVMIMVSFYYK